jgi:hypothetical protein
VLVFDDAETSQRFEVIEVLILDVLRNYTPYKLAFRLANDGQDWEQQEVERSAALKGIMLWVRLHPYNIAKKVEIVVEHYRENVQQLLNGEAKAMVVLGSRKEAVRWKLAIDGYIKSKGYGLGTLAAFSGEVSDQELSEEPLTEASATLNPGLKGRDIREAFAGADFHLLLVANKFQTGFDQALLCVMYVDRQGDLITAIEPAADRLLKRFKAAQELRQRATVQENGSGASQAKDELDALLLLKGDMITYQSAYSFLSQIFDYANTAVEKRFLVYKHLVSLLEFGRERAGVDLSKVTLTHHSLKNEGQRQLDVSGHEETKLASMTGIGSGSVQEKEKEKALLAEIIARVNDLFGGDTTDGNQLS